MKNFLQGFVAYLIMMFLAFVVMVDNDLLLSISIAVFITVVFIAVLVHRKFNRKEEFNPKNLKKAILDLDIENLGNVYNGFLNHFSNNYIPMNNTNRIAIRTLDKEGLEILLGLIDVNSADIILKRRKYLELNTSNTLFFQYTVLYSCYFLMNNEIDLFVEKYGEFRSKMYDRPEMRIMNQQLNEIDMYDTSIMIEYELLDIFHDFYSKNIDISKRVVTYAAPDRYHDMIHTYALYYYAKYIEDEQLVDDIYNKFQSFVSLRNTYSNGVIGKNE